MGLLIPTETDIKQEPCMDPALLPVAPEDLNENAIRLIGTDWMLITAGAPESFNTMTASWGALGVLWHKPVCFCFIRPPRHTFQFMERGGRFTLSFFAESYRESLNLCGTLSGRDTDKVARAGLTPEPTPAGAVTFREARLVLECRKIYYQDLEPGHFLDPAIDRHYPQRDYHRMYVGEILGAWRRRDGEAE
jgi:flavin reductase (DIM6/NTAB) family NADH-FMN oxidoreductase RutF